MYIQSISKIKVLIISIRINGKRKSLPIDAEEQPVDVGRSIHGVQWQVQLLVRGHTTHAFDLVAALRHVVNGYRLGEMIVDLYTCNANQVCCRLFDAKMIS